jgi:hypothetical protein
MPLVAVNMNTVSTTQAVDAYLASLDDEQTVKDARVLIGVMQRISGHPPQLWNAGTIGFDTYHFKYDSGREGDSQAMGFYPRKDKMTVYLMDGTVRHSELLTRLGKHSTSRVCVYIKRLSDIDLSVLERVMQQSYAYIKSQDGHMHRALEYAAKSGAMGPGVAGSSPVSPSDAQDGFAQ